MFRSIPRRPSARRGTAVLLLVLAMAGVAIGMGTLMVDLGYLLAEKSRVQSAADAASMAGALRLRSQYDDPSEVEIRALAIKFAELNQPDNIGVLSNADIEIGSWDAESFVFGKDEDVGGRNGKGKGKAVGIRNGTGKGKAKGLDDDEAAKSPAVRVTLRRNDNQSSAVTLFFARVFGKTQHDLDVASVCAFEVYENEDGDTVMTRPFLVQ